MKAPVAPRPKRSATYAEMEKKLPENQAPSAPVSSAREAVRGTRSAPVEQEQSAATIRNRFLREDAVKRGELRQTEWAPKIAQAQAQTTATRANERMDMDFAALQSGNPAEVKDWQAIARLTTSLSGTGDQEAQDLKNALLWSYGEQLKPHLNTLDADWWEKNYEDQPEAEDDSRFGWKSKVGKVTPFFEYLDQWGQDTLGAVAGVASMFDTDDGVSAGEGFVHALRSGARAVDVTRALPGTDGLSGGLKGDASTFVLSDGTMKTRDLDGDGTLNLREALGKDPEGGGRILGVFDLIGTMALDPTTYITFGASAKAKVGMKLAEEMGEKLAGDVIAGTTRRISREMVQEMNQRIARDGFKKGLDDVEQRWYTSILREGNESAVEGVGQRTTRFGRDVVDAQIDSIQRGGQSGMRFGGSTIMPTRGNLDKLGKQTDQFAERAVRQADEVPTQLTDDVADTGTDIVPARGVDARGNVDNVLSQTTGDLIDLPPSAIREVQELAAKVPPVTRLGDTAPTEQALTEVVRVAGQKGLLGEVLDLPGIRHVIDALSPRNAINTRFGAKVSDQLGHLLSVTRDNPEVKDIMVRMGADLHKGGLMRESIKEFGSQLEWEKALNEALSSKEGREAALQVVGPRTAQLVETMHDVRLRLRDVAVKGGANPEHMRNIDEYLPRVLTDASKHDSDLLQQIKDVGDEALATGDDRMTESFLKRRTVAEDLDNLFDTNSEAYRVLKHSGITSPKELFETNPVAAFASRSQSAFRAASDIDLLNGITKISGDGGVSLGFRATADDAGKLTADEVAKGMVKEAGGNIADYRKLVLDNGDVFRIHRDVAKELESVRRVFGDPKQMTKFGEVFDKVNNIWAMSATIMGVNPGFHIRNGIGNVFNAFLGGTRDVKVFAEASAMQTRMTQITKAMRDSGDDFAAAAKKLDIDETTMDILNGARKNGVINDGRSLDILRERGGVANTPTGETSKLNRINPADPNSVFNKAGVKMGEHVENNARLAVYIDQINKGATPEIASQHVKKYLFDYGDLTRFENEIVRRGSRFYTFMRKNTALQAYTLAKYPGRIANAEAGVDGIVDAVFGAEDEGGHSLPDWMAGARVMGIPGGGSAAVDVDTPFASFKETMEILTGPPSDDPLDRWKAEGGIGAFVNRSTSLFSGFGASVVDAVMENETGRDSFTGRPLDPENQMRDRGWFSAVSTVFPAMSRFEGIGARAGLTRFDKDGNPKSKTGWEMQLINVFSGLQTYELDDDTDGAGRHVLRSEIENIIQGMKDDGLDVPTVAEMREAGDLAIKNRVAEAIMYGIDPETGEWSDEVTDDRLLSIIPKNVREALGLPEPTQGSGRSVARGSRPDAQEGSEEELRQSDVDFKQALGAIEEFLGRDLTEDERWAMVSGFGGALGVTDQENAGFNPYRENRLAEGFDDNEVEDNRRKEQIFNQRLSAVGMSWDQALRRYPRISRMERRMNDAREAGWSEEEIRTALYYASDEGGEGWTSRADRAAINQFMTGDRSGGAVPLTLTRNPVTSEEDLQKLQTKVWEAAEELRLIYQFENWGAPSQDELFMYGVNALTKTEQRMLGIDPLKGAPNRKDARSGEEKLSTAQDRLGAVETGLAEGAYRWAPEAQPEYAPWER